jgi:hypothetical protein
VSIVSDGGKRDVPAELAASWERTTNDPDPLAALGASRSLAQEVDQWQGALVAEAIRDGATWEQIGETLGTSRQAAWARFRDVLEGEVGTLQEETAQFKARIRDEVRALREAMKALDESHRKARHEAVDRLREMELQARQERKEIRDRMKETIRSLQEELRDRKRPA